MVSFFAATAHKFSSYTLIITHACTFTLTRVLPFLFCRLSPDISFLSLTVCNEYEERRHLEEDCRGGNVQEGHLGRATRLLLLRSYNRRKEVHSPNCHWVPPLLLVRAVMSLLCPRFTFSSLFHLFSRRDLRGRREGREGSLDESGRIEIGREEERPHCVALSSLSFFSPLCW